MKDITNKSRINTVLWSLLMLRDKTITPQAMCTLGGAMTIRAMKTLLRVPTIILGHLSITLASSRVLVLTRIGAFLTKR
jgi:hypothetical protein